VAAIATPVAFRKSRRDGVLLSGDIVVSPTLTAGEGHSQLMT
jgi:hypothetical protein